MVSAVVDGPSIPPSAPEDARDESSSSAVPNPATPAQTSVSSVADYSAQMKDVSPPVAPELTRIISAAPVGAGAAAPFVEATSVEAGNEGEAKDGVHAKIPPQIVGVKRRASGSPVPISHYEVPAISASSISPLAAAPSSPSRMTAMPSASIMATAAAATAAAAVAAADAAANAEHISAHPTPTIAPSHAPVSSSLSGATVPASQVGMVGIPLSVSLQSLPILSAVNGLGPGAGPARSTVGIGVGNLSSGPVGMSVISSSVPPPNASLNLPSRSQKAMRDFSQSVRKKLHASGRTGQACDRCKVRKIRCDATPGGCTQCRQNSTVCRTTDRITGRATTRGHSDRLEMENQALRARLAEREQQLRDLGHDCHSADLLNPPPSTISMPIGVGLDASSPSTSPQPSTPDLQAASAFQHSIFQPSDMWSSSPSSALLSVSAYNTAIDDNSDPTKRGVSSPVAGSYEMHTQNSQQHPHADQSRNSSLVSSSHHHQDDHSHSNAHVHPHPHGQPHSHHSNQPQPSSQTESPDGVNGNQVQSKLKSLPFFGQAFEVPGMSMVAAEAGSENQPPSDLINTA